jgi:hypothetical protein
MVVAVVESLCAVVVVVVRTPTAMPAETARKKAAANRATAGTTPRTPTVVTKLSKPADCAAVTKAVIVAAETPAF